MVVVRKLGGFGWVCAACVSLSWHQSDARSPQSSLRRTITAVYGRVKTRMREPMDDEDVPASPADMHEVERTSLVRAEMLVSMPDEHYQSIIAVTLDLIERRFSTMQGLVDVNSKDINLNPFLMLAMAPAYNIYSTFEVAEYTQNAKMYHGDATAFGKYVESRILPIFGVTEPIEKKRSPQTYSPIDAELTVEGNRYLATWKSGPWTMNQAHAHEMIQRLPQIHDETGSDIILGIFYGRLHKVNNKPALVARGTGDYFHVLIGKDFWEFVTGVTDAHMVVYRAIREAQARFAAAHGGKTFFEHFVEARLALSQSFRAEFDLIGEDDDMWEKIFEKAF